MGTDPAGGRPQLLLVWSLGVRVGGGGAPVGVPLGSRRRCWGFMPEVRVGEVEEVALLYPHAWRKSRQGRHTRVSTTGSFPGMISAGVVPVVYVRSLITTPLQRLPLKPEVLGTQQALKKRSESH